VPGLEDLYKEIILDHYRSPRGRGELDVPPAHRAEGFNPLCGDEVEVFVHVEDARVADIRVSGQGCSISTSSASMMAEAVQGQRVDEVRDLVRTFRVMMSVHQATLDGPEAPAEVDGLDADGLSADEVTEVIDDDALGDLVALRGVLKFPQRIKCATLGWTTMVEALDEATST
jgi:nitrogen fixation NifU-like protein